MPSFGSTQLGPTGCPQAARRAPRGLQSAQLAPRMLAARPGRLLLLSSCVICLMMGSWGEHGRTLPLPGALIILLADRGVHLARLQAPRPPCQEGWLSAAQFCSPAHAPFTPPARVERSMSEYAAAKARRPLIGRSNPATATSSPVPQTS